MRLAYEMPQPKPSRVRSRSRHHGPKYQMGFVTNFPKVTLKPALFVLDEPDEGRDAERPARYLA